MKPSALIADDEPLLREHLQNQLAVLWPELDIVAQARNGREAVELFDELKPTIVFLDVHMPGMNGVEAARCIGARALVVFVTAYDSYAVEAFAQGALDYVVKPIETARLADTVQRLKTRVQEAAAAQAESSPAALEQLAALLRQQAAPQQRLGWIKASVGANVRLIPVDEVVYFRSDTKYTLVVYQGGESLIRKTIRELADALDPEQFVQIHRSVVVSLRQVSHVNFANGDSAELHLRGRPETLPVSRSYLHLFRQM